MLRLQPRDILTLLILLAGAGISGLLLKDTWDDDDKESKPELSLAYYLDRAELIGTGEDGTIVYQVWTDRAEQLRDDNSVKLSYVRMVYGPPDGLPWELKANEGRMPSDARIIELQGNVVATSGDDIANRTIIRTQQLEIDPATRRAETLEKVAIEYDGRVLNATGMSADFEKNQLKLLSNVNGKFLP
jgi:LPS export ABC transporter protein LptC